MAMISQRRRGTILIVDDDPDYAMSVAAFLSMEGFRTPHVSNGQDALDWIKNNGDPDVILLDIVMPVMSGPEFMVAYNGASPIIINTARDEYEQHLPFKPFDTLAKPFRPTRLFAIIETALEAKHNADWKQHLPCEHTCVTLEIRDDHLVFTCIIPGCEKRNAVHKDRLNFETVLALTLSIAQQQEEKEEAFHNS